MHVYADSDLSSELQQPTSWEAQKRALKALKNEIVGTDQRKEYWIRQGVVSWLARYLEAPQHQDSGWSEAHLQAIIIIGSLAHGMSPLTNRHSLC